MLRVASVIKQVWSEHASDNIHWKLFRSSGHRHLLLLPSVSHHLCTSLCFRDGGEKEKKQEKADKEKGDCICAVQINTSITVIQSRGWHVIDLLCWILSADWVIALLIRISSQKVGNPAESSNRHIHIHIRMRTHTHFLSSCILSFWPIRVHIIGAAGFLLGRETLTASESLCLCAACRPVFVVDLQFFVD